MTREEILNMPAGRDLDALIAENVFGYKLEGENKNVVIFPDGDFSYLVPDLGGHWSPSFDIREAIKVSEKLRDFVGVAPYRNFLRLEDLGDGTYAASFDVIFKDDEWYEEDHIDNYPCSASAETAPLAICRAALLTTLSKE